MGSASHNKSEMGQVDAFVPPHLSARLRLCPWRCHADGLVEGTESTVDMPPGKDNLLKKSMDGSQKKKKKKSMDGLVALLVAFLTEAVAGGRRPDWIISDFWHHWLRPLPQSTRYGRVFLLCSVA